MERLRTEKQRFSACPGRGLYLLLYRGDVVYIGRSASNTFARLGRHVRDKRFDEVEWHPIEPEYDLDAVEREMIKILQPVYNVLHK